MHEKSAVKLRLQQNNQLGMKLFANHLLTGQTHVSCVFVDWSLMGYLYPDISHILAYVATGMQLSSAALNVRSVKCKEER